MERWLPVLGYEGIYEASDLGRVKRLKGNYILKHRKSYDGYWRTTLHKDGNRKTLYVHTIVALAFLGKCPSGLQTDHVDGDKNNNSPANLQYVTPKTNIQRTFLNGRKPLRGEKHGYASISDETAKAIKTAVENWRKGQPQPKGSFSKLRDHLIKTHQVNENHVNNIAYGRCYQWL